MLLTDDESKLFFKLHRTLMFFVNERLKVIPDKVSSPEEFGVLQPELRLTVRNALLDKVDLIEAFVDENPSQLAEDELHIVRSWRHLVAGDFYIFRELKKYTVFLSWTQNPVAYGVTALTQPFEELVGPYLPVMTKTVLLPFKDKIVYDGLLVGPGMMITFGPGARRNMNESFKEAKLRYGIVTSLPVSSQPLAVKPPKARPTPRPPSKTEKDEVLRIVIEMTDQFCKQHLNEEYAVLCRKLAEKLARKRPSPLMSGKLYTWACGIVRTIGWVNFLHDKSQTPYMRLSDIDAKFGISESTGAAKLAQIRKMLKIYQLDPDWTLPSRLGDNPMVWLLSVNGFMTDVRQAPREVQEIAFNKGLIPYIPADRQQGE